MFPNNNMTQVTEGVFQTMWYVILGYAISGCIFGLSIVNEYFYRVVYLYRDSTPNIPVLASGHTLPVQTLNSTAMTPPTPSQKDKQEAERQVNYERYVECIIIPYRSRRRVITREWRFGNRGEQR
ncbi:hypothetical protein CNAG_00849 [Cryptococcus neoformans var. grubii H99]|uniref:Uncharacterized protein n=1 Tax=Cryptococcus neoformans (strain H99 / ATCC 208821 / CBS 10515 / FGSC 9487) TaxID=235443 RepID=J9VMS6_CRYN9|nr:hypothetical protein CNAG_00849 [Cryptococcus neoformans var. grubii H99]AFR92980.2 hypothetical protein CNAG_00849 [Cryptococcus neoformans var. grubii H99]AUB22465.1 hypothetical protein CKF44_00849 [Cryptococcus neoformans var. grubii]|eukprot:XP_012046451.1 hypothetical protein CNAG_00849 [Cryptococcus neoformans var. grubii H99]